MSGEKEAIPCNSGAFEDMQWIPIYQSPCEIELKFAQTFEQIRKKIGKTDLLGRYLYW